MNLNMWNLVDWLEKKGYELYYEILSTDAIITNARILNSDVSDPHSVYIGNNIDDKAQVDSVFMVNRLDIIYVRSADFVEIFSEVTQMFHSYLTWELDINNCALYKHGIQKMIDLSDPVFRIPIFLYDNTGKVLGISQVYPGELHYHWKELLTLGKIPEHRMEELKISGDLSRVFERQEPTLFPTSPFDVPYLYCPITINGQCMAHLVIFDVAKTIRNGDIYLMETLVEAMRSHYLIHYSDYVYNQQIVYLLSQLLEGKRLTEAELRPSLQHIGWSMDDTYLVLTLYEPVEGKPVMRDRIGNKMQKEIKHCQKIISEDNLIFVVNVSKYGQKVDVLLSRVQSLSRPHLICGCSYSFCGLGDIFLYYRQALLAMNCAKIPGDVIHIRDQALSVIGQQIKEDPLLCSLLHPDLKRIKAYDQENGTEFFYTLKAYLISFGNYTNMAKILHIHRNTAIYRMEHLRTMMTCDLEDEAIREYLLISCYFIS